MKNKSYLIKRSVDFTDCNFIKKFNSPKKGYTDTVISSKNRYPLSKKLKKGDLLYVAESGGSIYAKGIVLNDSEVIEFESIKQVLTFCKKRKDTSYWLDKITKFNDALENDPKSKLRFNEYFIKQELLERVIPFNGPLKKYVKPGNASSFFTLTEEDILFLEAPDYKLINECKLFEKIPNNLRLNIYIFMNKNYSIGHLIDIDHFVPKSVGGPGNIIENLVPIGFSLNRYKSNSIPRSFFEEAKFKFPEYAKSIGIILKDKDDFIKPSKSSKSQEIAKEITALLNDLDFDDARKFYLKVLNSFHKEYVLFIDEWNKLNF